MPVIIPSDVSDEDRMVDAFRAGADDYIIKPSGPASSSLAYTPI